MRAATASTAWTREQLAVFGGAEEVRILSQGTDGRMRAPVSIWIVSVGGELFVRSSHGEAASWFKAVTARHQAVIQAGGRVQRVGVVEDEHRAADVDAAYRTKYARYAESFLPALLSDRARGATLRLVPVGPAGGV